MAIAIMRYNVNCKEKVPEPQPTNKSINQQYLEGVGKSKSESSRALSGFTNKCVAFKWMLAHGRTLSGFWCVLNKNNLKLRLILLR